MSTNARSVSAPVGPSELSSHVGTDASTTMRVVKDDGVPRRRKVPAPPISSFSSTDQPAGARTRTSGWIPLPSSATLKERS